MFTKRVIYFILLITINQSVFSQTDSVNIFLAPKDKYIPIKKEEIKVTNNSYYSKFYNFSIDIPPVVKSITNKDLPNNHIFEITNEYSSLGFWVSQYSTMYYTKQYAERLMKHPEVFKGAYRKKVLKEIPLFKGSTIINDTIKIIHISTIPAIKYECHFKTRKANTEYNGQLIITQLFYKKFNYRLVCIYDATSPRRDVVIYLNTLLLDSFKILDTNN